MTSIEWTDRESAVKAGVGQDQPIYQSWIKGVRVLVQPRFGVSVPLRAVTGKAGRHNVSGSGPATATDRNDVVPGGRDRRTVCAPPRESLQEHGLSFGRDRFNAAAAGMGMLSAFRSVLGVLCVSDPRAGSQMDATKGLPRVPKGYPPTAITTPEPAHWSHREPLSPGRPRTICRAAIPTHVGVAIGPRAINVKAGKEALLAALRATLHKEIVSLPSAPGGRRG